MTGSTHVKATEVAIRKCGAVRSVEIEFRMRKVDVFKAERAGLSFSAKEISGKGGAEYWVMLRAGDRMVRICTMSGTGATAPASWFLDGAFTGLATSRGDRRWVRDMVRKLRKVVLVEGIQQS